MNKLLFVFVSILVITISVNAGDFTTVNTVEYEELCIPAWMMGPVWVQFLYDDCNYEIVHVLTDPTRETYILLTQMEKDTVKFNAMVNRVSKLWCGSSIEETITDRDDGICQVINIPELQHWESDCGEANVNVMNLTIKEYARTSNFKHLSVKVYFKGDLPIWAEQGLSSELNK